MSKIAANPRRTVRPSSQPRPSMLICVLVFAVIGGVVYCRGLWSARRAETITDGTSTAAITIRQQPTAYDPGGVDELSGVALPDAKEVRRQVASEARVRRAVGQLAAAGGTPRADEPREPTVTRSAETVRPKVRVSALETGVPGKLEISVTYTDPDAEYAARLVNALAEDFAKECRAAWQGDTQVAYAQACEASEHAQRQWQAAKSELEAFLERQPAPTADANESSSSTGPVGLGQVDSPEPPPVDNPDWIAVNERLAEVRRRREALLEDRTPAHPEVQKAGLEIAELERRLAALPRHVPGTPPSPEPPELPATSPTDRIAGDHVPQGAELTRELRELAAAVDRAAELCYQTNRARYRARQQQACLPRIELVLAEAIQVPAAPRNPGMGLVLMALAGGLAGAVGVGMVSAGAAMEPTLTTLEQAHRLLPMPIVGVIPETHPAGRPRAGRRWQRLLRPSMVLGGLILLAGSAAIVIRTLGG